MENFATLSALLFYKSLKGTESYIHIVEIQRTYLSSQPLDTRKCIAKPQSTYLRVDLEPKFTSREK